MASAMASSLEVKGVRWCGGARVATVRRRAPWLEGDGIHGGTPLHVPDQRRGWRSTSMENRRAQPWTPQPPQHILNCLVLVDVDLINPGLIFAMAKLVVLIGLATKVVSGLLHISDNFHTFEPDPLHPKLPSPNKILV
jgi:hypothetical protein